MLGGGFRRRGAAPWLIAASIVALGALAFNDAPAVAHSGSSLPVVGELSGWEAAFEFSKYGAKHILLGYDHLLFLAGLTVLSAGLRDVAAIIGLFAVSYSTTLIGGTLLGVAAPGDAIDAVIAISVGYVGVQIAFGRPHRFPSRNPRGPALAFGLAHGLGLSSLLQELKLPGDDLLPSVLGFNAGVELGQIFAMALFLGALAALRAFPFPRFQRIPAGCALLAAATVLLSYVALGVSL
jgi:hypothetical protein